MTTSYDQYPTAGLRKCTLPVRKACVAAAAPARMGMRCRPSFSAATAAGATPFVAARPAGGESVVVMEEAHPHHLDKHALKKMYKEKKHKEKKKHVEGKHCGFPWWVLVALVGIVALTLLWMWWDTQQRKKKARELVRTGETALTMMQSGGNGMGISMPAMAASVPVVAAATYAGQARPRQAQPVYMTPEAAQRAGGMDVSQRVIRATVVDVDRVTASGQPALVIYTMEGCPMCPAAHDAIVASAEYLDIPVFHVERSDIPVDRRPPGYPQIFLALPGDQRVVFDGDRTRDAILDFVVSNLGQNALTPAARR